VAKLIDVAIVLVANPATGPKTIREMIERSKVTPGGLPYGSTGTNTSQHLSVELLKLATGANLVHVPYVAAPRRWSICWPGRSRWHRWT